MYEWRKLNKEEQKELLEYRKTNKKPWHTLPISKETNLIF